VRKIGWYIIAGLITVLGLFPEFIANDDPILLRNQGILECASCQEWFSEKEYQTPASAETIISPLIPFDDRSLEPSGFTLLPPLRKGAENIHILGTDSQSRDVLAGIIYGFRYAALIALISALIAGLFGITLGLLAGYYGNDNAYISYLEFILMTIILSVSLYIFWFSVWISLFLAIITILVMARWRKHMKARRQFSLPIDQIIMKITDSWDSLPALFVLLGFITIMEQNNVFQLSVMIALFKWPGFFRIARAEIVKHKDSDWIRTLKDLNIPNVQIMWKELAPILVVPISVHTAFAMASAVSIEATLSFLGLGLSAEIMSWGALLMEARQYFSAWWLVVFPGLSLTFFLFGLNKIAKQLQSSQ